MLMVKGRGTNVRGQVEEIVFQKKKKTFENILQLCFSIIALSKV